MDSTKTHTAVPEQSLNWIYMYTAISIRVVHEQSGKVEYERERLLGIALKIH
jgi:hypothetical protein